MLALIGNLNFMELLVIAAGALLVFGRRLPEVAVRGAAQLVKLRRTVARMWRETGLEEELRKVRREVDVRHSSWSPPTPIESSEWGATVEDEPAGDDQHAFPREDHPEDFDTREIGDAEPGHAGEADGTSAEEPRVDIHAGPDSEPHFDPPQPASPGAGSTESDRAASEGLDSAVDSAGSPPDSGSSEISDRDGSVSDPSGPLDASSEEADGTKESA